MKSKYEVSSNITVEEKGGGKKNAMNFIFVRTQPGAKNSSGSYQSQFKGSLANVPTSSMSIGRYKISQDESDLVQLKNLIQGQKSMCGGLQQT